MTTNQLAYLNLMENQRKRIAELNEARRANLAKEAETNRANIAKEQETIRANSMNESIKIGELQQKATPKWAMNLGFGIIPTIAPTQKSTDTDNARSKYPWLNDLLKDNPKMIKEVKAMVQEGKAQGLSDDEIEAKIKERIGKNNG